MDYHEAQLAQALAEERPELYIALQLNSADGSPWHRRLNLGGKTTAGLKRIVSLRMMQQAVREFLRATKILSTRTTDETVATLLDFWKAVIATLPDEWVDTRHHMLTKGIGVYALMRVAADIYLECKDNSRTCDMRAFTTALSDFAHTVDWSTSGPLKGFGGQGGVKAAVDFIRDARKRARYKVVNG